MTGCNRTYYGDLGMTNSLELLRPKDDRLPFMCELNFTAAGGIHGDIIQVSALKCKHFNFVEIMIIVPN